MILSPFDVKFDEKKHEIPPKAKRPPTNISKNPKITKYVARNGSPRPPVRPSGRGERRRGKGGEEERVREEDGGREKGRGERR